MHTHHTKVINLQYVTVHEFFMNVKSVSWDLGFLNNQHIFHINKVVFVEYQLDTNLKLSAPTEENLPFCFSNFFLLYMLFWNLNAGGTTPTCTYLQPHKYKLKAQGGLPLIELFYCLSNFKFIMSTFFLLLGCWQIQCSHLFLSLKYENLTVLHLQFFTISLLLNLIFILSKAFPTSWLLFIF